MIRSAECYRIEDWKLLLHENADFELTHRLQQHLEECEPCRQMYDSLACGPEWWQDAKDMLTSDGSNTVIIQETASEQSEFMRHFLLQVLQPAIAPNEIGRLGKYSVREIVGSGGMGIVVKAFDSSLSRTVALKLLHPHLASMGIARQRFSREAQAAASIVHSHVVPIHAVVDDVPTPYLVMAYIDGESLQERIDRLGALPLPDCFQIASQIADGLSAAHAQGFVHRDIKPANILLESGTNRVWLTDFGLARTLDDATLTVSGLIAGTPQYMSPEQARGVAIDHRSDLFSFGSVLYAMLTGRPPFRAESSLAVLRRIADEPAKPLRSSRPELPPWIDAALALVHAKDPHGRYYAASDLARIFSQAAQHVQNPARSPLPTEFRKMKAKQLYRKWLTRAVVIGSALVPICLIAIATSSYLSFGNVWQGFVELVKPTQQVRSLHMASADRAHEYILPALPTQTESSKSRPVVRKERTIAPKETPPSNLNNPGWIIPPIEYISADSELISSNGELNTTEMRRQIEHSRRPYFPNVLELWIEHEPSEANPPNNQSDESETDEESK